MAQSPSGHFPHLTRREFLVTTAAALIPGAVLAEPDDSAKFALPGPFRGRVVEVTHPGSVVDHKVRQEPVREMMRRGMMGLTGTPDEAAAWKRFFKPGDVVGIKICPVGRPRSVSQPETLMEVIRGLKLVGIPNKDIILFNRYEEEFQGWEMGRALLPGIRTIAASEKYTEQQTDTDGYDTAVFKEFDWVMTGADPKNPVHRRSYLCKVISQQVTKVVNVGVLKDHASAGITMALKNLSHGCNNNVCRTHATSEMNRCDIFIPTMVSQRPIREKVVLHIGDALIATYNGGPGSWNKLYRDWERGSLFFATDPVAMDRVGWDILDKKRIENGFPPLAKTGKKLTDPGGESFDRRQPEHVLLAAKMGLGEADLARIDHRVIALKG